MVHIELCVCVCVCVNACVLDSQHHLQTIDPEGELGLSDESVHCYSIGDHRRQVGNALLPPLTPYQATTGNNDIRVLLKGTKLQCTLKYPQSVWSALPFSIIVRRQGQGIYGV